MKLLHFLSALSLCVSAQARIGETMSQALTRLGAADKRETVKDAFVYSWKRENVTTEITFKKGVSTQEKYIRSPGQFSKDQIAKMIADSGPGPWQTFEESGVYTNGKSIADASQKFEVVVTAAPKDLGDVDKLSLEELRAAMAAEKEAESVERTAGAAKVATERAVGTVRVVGKVAAIYKEGLLLQGHTKYGDFHAKVLIAGHPQEQTAVDGENIFARVKPAGTFEFKGEGGAITRVQKLQFVSELSEKDAIR